MSHNESDEEMYSITSSKTVYRRSKSRPSSVMVSERWEDNRTTDFRDLPRISDSDERRHSKTYCPVTRWAVDYNNQNYVRSKCNKNKGLHRKIRGRPLDWLIEYDNSYFNRSKVNAPKGLHRRIPDLKRKYVPDNDDLADATGWEFDCGPEWDQVEQDVTYIPEGRIVARGCYRWYGVRRNDSDCDLSLEETRENLLNEKFEKQLKHGQEFLQADRPYMAEQLERRYSRGGYRFYETQRNAYDIKPDEIENAEYDPEWRRQHHINGFRYLDLDLEMCEDEEEFRNRYVPKGKPFRRTILNKVYELRRRVSRERPSRYGTRLSLVPGEGRKSLYEGVSDRFPFKSKKTPPIQDVFRRRRHSREKYESDYEGEYRQELKWDYADRMRRMASDRRRRSRDDSELGERSRRSGVEEYAYRVGSVDERETGKLPERGPKRSRSVEVQEAFDTWKDNTVNQKSEKTHHSEARSPRERKGESKRSAPRQDEKSGERRSAEKKYDHEDRALRRSKTRGENLKDFGRSTEKLIYKGSDKRYDHTEKKSHKSKSISRSLQDVDELKELGKYDSVKKLPPHVQKRMKKIHENMERKMSQINEHQHKENYGRITLRKSLDSIDLMKHKGHPGDHGYKHEDEYEKYETKNGSEVWVRNEETFSELHHKNPR